MLDIETLHSVDWRAIRAAGGFRPAADACWASVWPAQVCAVRFDGGEESARLSTTIDWGSAAPPLANPHCPGLTPAAISGGVSPATFFDMLADLADGADAFVGDNVDFDMGCLRHHAAAAGRPLPEVDDVCLMQPAADRMGVRRWPKLSAAYDALCGPHDPARAHDAEYDVHMTCGVFRALCEVSD